MEEGFHKANSNNLPKIDALMLGMFFASNTDFCSAEFRNIKTSMSSRASYGDDAISYVQLKREGKIFTVKCKICPEHKVRAKLYAVQLEIDEASDVICSVKCLDCVAAHGGCKHAIAFLMWVHRRSEEPACTSVDCYWKKSKLSMVGTSLKYITAKEMSKGNPVLSTNPAVLTKFYEEGKKRKMYDCELLKYSSSSYVQETNSVSLHQLVLLHCEEDCDLFLDKVNITDAVIQNVEQETREQCNSNLWFELRYGRITASRAYEVSHCKTNDGALIAVIMGGKIPDTKAMKRGRLLEDSVRKAVELKLGKIKKCGLILSKKYPMIAGSPDGICEGGVIEIKCPLSAKTYTNYVKESKPALKYYTQMQIQMFLAGKNNCFFCVADPDYSDNNKKVEIMNVLYNKDFVTELIETKLLSFWKENVYKLIYQCCAKKSNGA